MSSEWSWFIIVGTLGTLIACLVLLYVNRKTSGDETTGHDYDGIHELDNPLPMWWVGFFVITVVYAFGYLIYYPGLGNLTGSAGWTSTGQWQDEVDRHDARFEPIYSELAAMTVEQLGTNRRGQQVGRRLFINNCSTCHGVNAEGSFGFPNLSDDVWIWGGDFDVIKASILSGRVGIMPPWGTVLGDDGVRDVTAYTLSLAGREHDTDDAARGQIQYNNLCIACHLADGTGNVLLGAPDLANDVWLYGRSFDEIAFTIRNGRNGNMPSFADVLGEQKAHILAGYIHSLSNQ